MSIILTVVIPTFNRKRLTDRAVNSVYCKDNDLVEIIVIDDFSKQPYQFSDTVNIHGVNVRIFREVENNGPGVSRRIGVNYSRGKIVAFLDSDDYFDNDWVDCILSTLTKYNVSSNKNVFIVGYVRGVSSLVVRVIGSIIAHIPVQTRLFFVRLVMVVISNPFHTPSIALSKNICYFDNKLRFCEDYYTNSMGIFTADDFILVNSYACNILTKQGSPSGVSNRRWDMFKGEMSVRRSLLLSNKIPNRYKVLIPVGILYQIVRTALKMIFD